MLAAWCCMCKNHWETGDHLLLHCEIATALWGFVFHMFGIHWVLPDKVLELLFGWYNWFGKHSSDIWNLVPLCLMWSLWQERNQRVFEDLEKSVFHLQEHFSGLLFDCSRSWGFTAASSPRFCCLSQCFLILLKLFFVCFPSIVYSSLPLVHVLCTWEFFQI